MVSDASSDLSTLFISIIFIWCNLQISLSFEGHLSFDGFPYDSFFSFFFIKHVFYNVVLSTFSV
jgi:hypothetical protein